MPISTNCPLQLLIVPDHDNLINLTSHNPEFLVEPAQSPFWDIGRVPGSATYTKLRVGQSDSFKLSSLHGSRNHKLLQSEGIKIIIYLCCMEVGTKVVE